MSDPLARLEELSNELDRREADVFMIYFDISRDWLMGIMGNNRIIAVNGQWTEILGWEPDELVGQLYRNYFHPEDREFLLAEFIRRKDAPYTNFPVRFRHKNGSYVWFEVSRTAWDSHGLAHLACRKIATPLRHPYPSSETAGG